jgi:hypothetical protein
MLVVEGSKKSKISVGTLSIVSALFNCMGFGRWVVV